jgi:hypothetical protein
MFMLALIGLGAVAAAIAILMHPNTPSTTEPRVTTADLEANPAIMKVAIAGINFRQGIARYVGRFSGHLVPEPTNTYDPNAIAILHDDGHLLGYVPATETIYLHNMLANLFPYDCVGEITDAGDDFFGSIYFLKPAPPTPSKNPTPNTP